MRFFHRGGKGGAIVGKKDLVSPEKIAKVGRTDALIERLTQLKEAGADVVLRERRLTGAAGESTGFIGTKQVANLAPMLYEDDLKSRHGGGLYEISFMSKGKTLMAGGDDGPPELYTVEIAGLAKSEKKEKHETPPKSTADKALDGAMSLFKTPEVIGPILAAVTNALAGRNHQVDQTQVTNGILDIIVKVKDVFSNPAPDAMGQIREVAAAARELGTLFQPPITTGAPQASGGGLSDIIEGAARAFLPLIQERIMQAPPTGDGSQSPGASATPGAALPITAGHPPGGEVMGTPAQEPKLPVIDGLGQLRRMVAAGVEAEAAGEYAARVIDAFVDLSGPGGVPPQWRDYATNPDAAASLLPGMVPEVAARGAEYQERFLSGAVQVLKTWAEQESEGANVEVQSDDIEDAAAGSQPEEAGEPGAGGGQSEGTSIDAGKDPDGSVN